MSSAKALFPIYSKPDALDIVYNTSYSTEGLIAALVPAFSETLTTKAMAPFYSGRYTLTDKQLTDMAGNVKPVQSLEAMIQSPDPKYRALQNFYMVADIVRSYIDMAHDFPEYFRDFSTPIIKIVEAKVIASMRSKNTYPLHVKFYNEWMAKVNTKGSGIFTRDGNVSQPRCRSVMEDLVDAYLLCLRNPAYVGDAVVDWIPLTKTDAYVASYEVPKDDDAAIKKVRDQLGADGVDHYYVESDTTVLGKKLRDPSTMKNVRIAAGLWDAGSGFGTEKTIDTYLQTTALYQASPASASASASMASMKKAANKEYFLLASDDAEGYARPITRMFGFADVKTKGDNSSLRIEYEDKHLTIKAKGDKPENMAVNRIAITLGRAAIRGKSSGEDAEDEDEEEGSVLPIPYLPPSAPKDVVHTLLPILKTWTDPIQLRCISMFKATRPDVKIATIIFDICCETTARMNGLGHVLLTSYRAATYYSYDMNSRSMNKSMLEQKSKVLSTVLNALGGIHPYIDHWFTDRIQTLRTLHLLAIDPRVFLVTRRIQTRYVEQREKAMEALVQLNHLRTSRSTRNAADWLMDYKNKVVTMPADMEDWLKSLTLADELGLALQDEWDSLTHLLDVRTHLSWLSESSVSGLKGRSDNEIALLRDRLMIQMNRVRQTLRNVVGTTETEGEMMLMAVAVFCTVLIDIPRIPIVSEKSGSTLLDLLARFRAHSIKTVLKPILDKLPKAGTSVRDVMDELSYWEKHGELNDLLDMSPHALFPSSLRAVIEQNAEKLIVKNKDLLVTHMEFVIFVNYLQLFLQLMAAGTVYPWIVQPFRASQTGSVMKNAAEPLIDSWKDLYTLVHSDKPYTLQMAVEGSTTPSIEAYHQRHPVSPDTQSPTTRAAIQAAREDSKAKAVSAESMETKEDFNYSFDGLMQRIRYTLSDKQHKELQGALIDIQHVSIEPTTIDEEKQNRSPVKNSMKVNASTKAVSTKKRKNSNNIQRSTQKKSKPAAPTSQATGALIGKSTRKKVVAARSTKKKINQMNE